MNIHTHIKLQKAWLTDPVKFTLTSKHRFANSYQQEAKYRIKIRPLRLYEEQSWSMTYANQKHAT